MTEPLHEFNWSRLADMPEAKWEPASLVLNDKLIVLGGYGNYIVTSRLAYEFDPADGAQGSWTELQMLPSTISHVNLVADGNGFWYAGGMKDKPSRKVLDHIIAEVWYFDLEQDRLIMGPMLPERRGAGGLARLGDNLHYVSGLEEDRDTDSKDHWVLDLNQWKTTGNATWESAAPFPLPRNQLAVVTMNDKIYAIGGQFNHDLRQLDQTQVDIYDPQSDSWSRGPELPVPHSHSEHATVVRNDRIWMIGGHQTPEGGSKGFCQDVLTMKEGGEWELSGLLPKPISSPAAGIINNRLYSAGGWDGRMTGEKDWLSSADVWVADVPESLL
ncbi:MAG: Kelch repeat-containing protein [Woeseiaceae bacterium]